MPASMFGPVPSRLAWLPVHIAIVAAATTVLAAGWLPWAVDLVLSFVIGISFAGLTFLGHETLHGAVVRTRWLQHLVGWFGFLPFVVSPTLWIGWHNRVHHANANRPGKDPDLYPTLAEYKASRVTRFATDHFALGRRRWTGILSLFLGFSVHSAHVLGEARRLGVLTARKHFVAIAETALGVGCWTAVALFVGPVPFVFAFFVPLLIANAIVMAFILTNHGLSPLTNVNDPLVNALSVTAPRWIEWLTLEFGLHVEHHLFPSMSSCHARELRELVRTRWPERYQSMPVWRAIQALHRTSRVYKDATTFVDPRTGEEWPTLRPRPEASERLQPAA